MSSEHVAVGIDLGTCNSCVGVYINGRLEVLQLENSKKTMRSMVGFVENGDVVVGETAEQMCKYENIVYGVKRIIGKKFFTPTVEEDIKRFPFKVVNVQGEPAIQVKTGDMEQHYKPEAISALVLKELKKRVEERLAGQKVKEAVITVPAHFEQAQLKATRAAAEEAGLDVLMLVKEPTAAAIAYGLDRQSNENRTILVYDLGAGTFDVTVLVMEGDSLVVKVSDGDNHLGGDDFTNRLVEYYAGEMEDLRRNPKGMNELRKACEQLKINLSKVKAASLPDFVSAPRMTRAEFENLSADLFQKTIDILKDTLSRKGISNTEVTDIVLVGGSTRIPKIQQLLKDFFGRTLTKGMFPEEAVVRGATYQAAKLSESCPASLKCITLCDVVSLSIRIANFGGSSSVIIERNTPIPHTSQQSYTTIKDNQTTMNFPIYEGERPLTKDNTYLGNVTLHGLRPAPRGVAQVDAHCCMDENSILHITAWDRDTGQEIGAELDITKPEDRDEEEVVRTVKCAQEHCLEDEVEESRLGKRLALQYLLGDIKAYFGRLKTEGQSSSYSEKGLEKEIEKALVWLESSEGQNATEEKYEEIQENIEKKWKPQVRASMEASDGFDSLTPLHFL